MPVHTGTHMRTQAHTCLSAHTHAHTHACLHTRAHMRTHRRAHLHTCTLTHTPACTPTRPLMHFHTHVHTCTNPQAHTHARLHRHMHARTHAPLHTCCTPYFRAGWQGPQGGHRGSPGRPWSRPLCRFRDARSKVPELDSTKSLSVSSWAISASGSGSLAGRASSPRTSGSRPPGNTGAGDGSLLALGGATTPHRN